MMRSRIATLAVVLAVLLVVPQGTALGVSILFIGNNATPTSGADGAVMTYLEGRYGAANVTYQQASATAAGSELAYDALVISSTPLSTAIRNKFQNSAVGILNWEEAVVDDEAGEFQLAQVNKPGGQTQINVVDASHYITASLPLGPRVVFGAGTETIAQSGLISSGVQTLAQENGSTDATLFVADTGATLFGDGSAGRPDTAFGRRATFPITDSGFNNLNDAGRLLFGRTVDWVAGLDAPSALGPDVVVPLPVPPNPAYTNQAAGTVVLGDGWEPYTVMVENTEVLENWKEWQIVYAITPTDPTNWLADLHVDYSELVEPPDVYDYLRLGDDGPTALWQTAYFSPTSQPLPRTWTVVGYPFSIGQPTQVDLQSADLVVNTDPFNWNPAWVSLHFDGVNVQVDYEFTDWCLTSEVIPEPASMALLTAGCLALAARRRRRR